MHCQVYSRSIFIKLSHLCFYEFPNKCRSRRRRLPRKRGRDKRGARARRWHPISQALIHLQGNKVSDGRDGMPFGVMGCVSG
ncbi:hypothetical protein CEXT_225761 [Caerostris extrusa]|uniref:Uncharacterized protein n=1 Tax=Caerostris extrusa TaxID=172846 RepID=A0AAV4YBH0_CAEEX|nr:hypothetical protein CEXT_225761 [Caerostris extrusa]